jgi:hypothetical protein
LSLIPDETKVFNILFAATVSNKKGKPGPGFPCVQTSLCDLQSTEVGVVTARPVNQNGRVEQFSAAGAFPGVERADEIVVFLCEHAASATWTLHTNLPLM